MSDFEHVAIDFARARHDKRLVYLVAVAGEHNLSVVIFQNSDWRYCVFALCGVKTVIIVILLRGAIENKSVRRFFDDYAVCVCIGIYVKNDFTIRLGECGDEKFRI